MARPRPVIAIDGPAGAGKSTAARMLAQKLGYVLVDTGAIYRGVALAAKEKGVTWTDGAALGALARSLKLSFEPDPTGGSPRLHIDGRDRSGDIRTPDISMGASDVSKHPEVRAALLELQRRLGAEGGVVLEGRDIGTVVFPDAEVKVFLTASPETRARRRFEELTQKGTPQAFDSVLAEVKARDHQDSTRAVAPLKPAADAVTLDTTGLPLDEVLARLEEITRQAAAGR
jgi:cytidylate kinase